MLKVEDDETAVRNLDFKVTLRKLQFLKSDILIKNEKLNVNTGQAHFLMNVVHIE